MWGKFQIFPQHYSWKFLIKVIDNFLLPSAHNFDKAISALHYVIKLQPSSIYQLITAISTRTVTLSQVYKL